LVAHSARAAGDVERHYRYGALTTPPLGCGVLQWLLSIPQMC
jgi:hypothetical protein